MLRHWDWSETSQTVSVFCRELGVVRGIAKGAKREKGSFSGGLEVMTRGELLANVKSSDALALLTAWDLQEMFPAARTNLGAFNAGMLMLDLVQHAVRELDPHPPVWDALLAGLRSLDAPRARREGVLRVAWSVLADTGHMPEVDADARTGEPLAAAATYAFDPRGGGLVRDAGAADSTLWRVRAETVHALRDARGRGPLDRHADDSLDRAARLLAAYFREVFGVEPGAMRPYFGEIEPRRG